MEAILDNILAAKDQLTLLLYLLLGAFVLDTLSGALAAVKSGTFAWSALWTSVQSHGLKILIVLLQALAAVWMGGVDNAAGAALLATTVITAGQYLVSAAASIGLNAQDFNAGTKGLPPSA